MTFFSKLKWPFTSTSKVDEIVAEKVDNALTEYRKAHDDFNRPPIQGSDDVYEGDTHYSYLYYPPNVFHFTEKHKRLLEGVSPEVRQIVEDSFTTNPLAIRELSDGELFLMQDACVSKYFTDPHATSIANNIVFYVMGSGLQVKTPDVDVTEVLREFNVNNRNDERCKKMCLMAFLEGEYPLAYFVNPTSGDVFLRRVQPRQITDIETNPEDIEAVTGYYRDLLSYTSPGTPMTTNDPSTSGKWIKDVDYDKKLSQGLFMGFSSAHDDDWQKNYYIQLIKIGPEDQLRGRPPMQSVLRFLKYYEDFLLDRIRLNHERSKVVWIKSIKGRGKEAQERDRKAPKGGVMLVENENVTYRIESAKLESGDAERDALMILYAIASGITMPIYILDQRSDQQVYASIRKADTPFSQMIINYQDFWYLQWERIYRKVIEFKVAAKQLPEKTTVTRYLLEAQVEAARNINTWVMEGKPNEWIVAEAKKILDEGMETVEVLTVDIPLDIVFPDVVRENLLEQAQVLQIHSQIGIASRATLSAKAGYNWPMELLLLKKEETQFPPPEPKDGRAGNPRASSPKTNAP